MKFISWNVNGIRACLDKGFLEFINKENPDFVCVGEIKAKPEQINLITDYKLYINSALKPGYSGTMIMTKKEPLSVHYGLIDGKENEEGRVITLEYDNFYLVNAYIPNSQNELKRLDYRMEFEDKLRSYFKTLTKPIVYCGDLNVAHKEIDLKNPKSNERNAGFTIEERDKFSVLLNELNLVDSFRYLNNDVIKYSWWSYRFSARTKNIGWRIDYFLVSECLKDKIKAADIYTEILGSDHAPILLELDI